MLKTVLHSIAVDRIVMPFSWITACHKSAISLEHPKSACFVQKPFASIISWSNTRNLLLIPPVKLGAIYKIFGLPLGHSPFLTGQILWMFHMSFALSNSVCIKPIKQNRITPKWNGLLGSRFPVSHKSFKKNYPPTKSCSSQYWPPNFCPLVPCWRTKFEAIDPWNIIFTIFPKIPLNSCYHHIFWNTVCSY